MEINKIEISGFKGIKTLSITPKKVNILVGKNNTGKTSLLEAIKYVFDQNELEDPLEEENTELSKLINVRSKEANIRITTKEEVKSIQFSRITAEEVSQEFPKQIIDGIKKSFALIINRESNKNKKSKRPNDDVDLENISTEISDVLNNKLVMQEVIKTSVKVTVGDKTTYVFTSVPRELRRSKVVLDHIKRAYPDNIGLSAFYQIILDRSLAFLEGSSKEHEKIVAFISDLKNLPDNIKKSKINDVQNYLKRNKIVKNLERFDIDELLFKDGSEVPYSFMGDGFKCLVGLLFQISKSNKIILLEEPENHMHPAYIKETIKYIINFSKENNIQFFITTHSLDFLDMLLLNLPKNSYEEFLNKNLNIIRLESFYDDIVADELDFKSAKENLGSIQLDLRGNS